MIPQAEDNLTAEDFVEWRDDRRERARAIVDGIPFGRRQRRIVTLLVERFGRWTSTEAIIAATWFDDPDGGPMTAIGCVKQHVHAIRRRLAPHGLTVEWHAGGERRLVFAGEGAWA